MKTIKEIAKFIGWIILGVVAIFIFIGVKYHDFPLWIERSIIILVAIIPICAMIKMWKSKE